MFRNIDILIGGYNLFQVYVKILYFCYSICCYNLFEDARKEWCLLCTAPGRCAPIRGNNGRCTADGIA